MDNQERVEFPVIDTEKCRTHLKRFNMEEVFRTELGCTNTTFYNVIKNRYNWKGSAKYNQIIDWLKNNNAYHIKE